jgi:hypothetical protein
MPIPKVSPACIPTPEQAGISLGALGCDGRRSRRPAPLRPHPASPRLG